MAADARTGDRIALWRDERVLRLAAQLISAVIIIGFLYWAVVNFLEATSQRGMLLTYEFLKQPAGFPIAESFIAYEPTMSFGRLSWLASSILLLFPFWGLSSPRSSESS